jgi:hypothetical protein
MGLKATKLWSWSLAMALGLFSFWIQPRVFPAQPSPGQAQGITKGQTEKGIPYMSGGVGSEEREQMTEQAGAYNLGLAFAGKSRQFLSDVNVAILDDKGNEIVRAISYGPWFFVKLPPGNYNVRATYGGKVQEVKNIRLAKAGSARRTLIWDVE